MYYKSIIKKGDYIMDLLALLPTLPKRKNMSVDIEKTMERCVVAWKGLKNTQKNEVLELADVSSATLHKTYKQGHISAGTCLALSKIAGVAPLYLCGSVDKAGRFTAKTLRAFLEVNDMLPAAPEVEEETAEACDCCDCDTNDLEALFTPEELEMLQAELDEAAEDYTEADLSDDDMLALLDALMIRARFNPVDAELLAEIKHLLLC